MITKSEQHDTDRTGRNVLTSIMEALNFVENIVTDDYGVDYNVQAFDGKNPTGAWFHVQLKSSAHLSYSADLSFISFSLDIDHLFHYAVELVQPIFITLVDTTTKRLFWFAPQIHAANIVSAKNDKQQTLAFRVPISQELPKSVAEFLESLKKTYILLASRTMIGASVTSFQEALSAIPNQEELFTSFQEKANFLLLYQIASDYRAGRLDDAVRRAEKLVTDEDATLAAKYHAMVQLHAIEWSRTLRSGIVGPRLAEPTLKFSKRVRTLIKLGPPWVKLTAIYIEALAKLERMVHQDGADYMTLQQQAHIGDSPLTILGLLVRRTASAKLIWAQYIRCYRLCRLASINVDRWALCRVLTRLPTTIAPYLIGLRTMQMKDAESVFVNSSIEVLEWASAISIQVGDSECTVLSAMSALSLAENENSKAYKWALQLIEQMPVGKTKEAAAESVQKAANRWRGESSAGDYDPDPMWQIVQKIALSRNVDISDEKSVFVRRLRIAAKDDSPERVLRFCENMVMTFGSISPIDREIRHRLAIDTSTNKTVHCRLFDLHVEAVDADTAFARFKEAYCNICTDRVPRSDDWHYSPETRKQLDAENGSTIKRWFATGKGMRFTDKDDLE